MGRRHRAGATPDDPPAPPVRLSSFEDLGAWPGILSRLASGTDLEPAEASAALGQILAGEAAPSQVAAFLFGLRCKGESVGEMRGLVGAMLDAAVPVPVEESLRARLVDTCGTGGDRSGTINVSTVAALVVAAAGVPVCKHGGRASSSRCGSADLLEALGVDIELDGAGVARCIVEAGIGFCFAPRFHPAMRHAAPVRRELGVPTAFNFLGPLANPARVRRQVVGVGDPSMAERMAAVLRGDGAAEVLVVHGDDGLDELTTTTTSQLLRASAGAEPVRSVVDPAALGLAPARPADLLGGDPATNAALTRRILAGEAGPQRDIVLLNAAAGLLAGAAVGDLAEGLVVAAAAVDEGRAEATLDRLLAASRG